MVKINTPYEISLLVKDSMQQRVLNDTPVATIFDKNNSKYFNGLFWVDDKIELSMMHVVNGVYTVKFVPETISEFEVCCKSNNYDAIKTETIRSYTDEIPVIEWPVNIEFGVIHRSDEEYQDIAISIYREFDKTYFNGDEWVFDFKEIPKLKANSLERGVNMYRFTPDMQTDYTISLFKLEKVEKPKPEETPDENTPELINTDSVVPENPDNTEDSENNTEVVETFLDEYILRVLESSTELPPVQVSNKTIKYVDGSDTTVMDERGMTIQACKVTAYDMDTKNVCAVSQTNRQGEWSMALKPGNYLFLFERDKYVSVSLERRVI